MPVFRCDWCGRFYSSQLPEGSACDNHIHEHNERLQASIKRFNERLSRRTGAAMSTEADRLFAAQETIKHHYEVLPMTGDQGSVKDEEAMTAQPPPNIVDLAVEVAGWSPCLSKRGVVIFRGDNVVTHGYNYKPSGFDCTQDSACKATCRSEAIHAEQQALLHAGRTAEGADMLHVKAVNGSLVASGGPSCVECSKLARAVGIAGVWLYHEDGWRRYPIVEFHERSLVEAEGRSNRGIEPCWGQCGIADLKAQLTALQEAQATLVGQIRELVNQWRDAAVFERDDMRNTQSAQSLDQCADELSALLSLLGK